MSEIPYFRRKTQHKIGNAGRASEQRLARGLGGRQRPGSGNMDGAKGDIAFGPVLVEAKSTIKDSLGVQFAWLHKIGEEARAEGKMPALSVSFVKHDGEPRLDGDWVMIPLWKFKELTE